MSNYASQSQEDYQIIDHPSPRKRYEVINLEISPSIQSPSYRFEWISEKSKHKNWQPLNTRDSTRNINLPLGHFLSSSYNSLIDSKIAHSHKGEKNNNSPVATIQCRKTTDNLSQRNKSYPVVNINFEKLLLNKGSNALIECKNTNIFGQSINENKIKNKDYNLKIKSNDDSLCVKNEKVYKPIKCTKYTKPVESCSTTECAELQKAKENISVTQNDLKCERDLSENDNKFEITILNNHQLEKKTIII